MNGTNRTRLMIGMVVVLVGIFSSAVFAENVKSESTVDATVVKVAHWQTMNPDVLDSTLSQVAHRRAMAEVFSADKLVQVDAGPVAEVVIQR